MAITKQYVVGAKLPASGLFHRTAAGEWVHDGFNHPFLVALDYDAREPSTLFLAAGNGLIRAAGGGTRWTVLTGGDVTELRDVAADRRTPGTIYFGHSAGIRATHDNGATWQELSGGLHRKFTEALRVDREHAGVLLAGGEEGIFRSQDGGTTWSLAGAAGFEISRLEQSPHDSCYWLATTQRGGLFESRDCGRSFENTGGRLGVNRNLYDIAFDPNHADRIAVAGWGVGVAITQDNGKSWGIANSGLPSTEVKAVAFDPDHEGWIYAGVHEEALYLSKDGGGHWSRDGLDGSSITRLKFIPRRK